MSVSDRAGRPRRLVGAALAFVAAAVTLSFAPPAGAVTPPWQTPGNVNNDPNAVGTLAFYDASGTQIFSGDVTSQPFAAYIAGSTALRADDTNAALFAYLPDPNTPAGAWTGSLLTAASTYPNASAPGALATAAPLLTGAAGDTSVADFIAGHPNNSSTSGYAGVYELRLRTTASGRSATPTYDVADIAVSGNNWQVVYPQHFTDTNTGLGVAPNTGLHAGATVTLTATVTPSDATGTVHFTDGSTALGADVTVSAGTATKQVKITTAGTHTFHATFIPDSNSSFAGSTTSTGVSVAKAATATTATWPSTSPHYGSKWTVATKVTATGITPSGKVSLKSGTTTLASGTLSGGKATLTVPGTALKPGSHALTLVYGGSANATGSQIAKTLSIAKASPHVTNTLASSTVKHTAHAKLTVKVTATGVTPSGAVAVYDGTIKIATGTLNNGSVTITLPLLSIGKHSIHAKYLGSNLVGSASAAAVTLTVVK